MKQRHWAIFVNNESDKQGLIRKFMGGSLLPEEFAFLSDLKGAEFSKRAIDCFIEEEARHDRKLLAAQQTQSLQSMSSGERKKALFQYLLHLKPDFLIIDDPFDNLDIEACEGLKTQLKELASHMNLIQFVNRSSDLLPFIKQYAQLQRDELKFISDTSEVIFDSKEVFQGSIPGPIEKNPYELPYLIQFKKVSVHYGAKPILKDINWDIKPGDYWQLKGKNGSGKTTLLSMITGENPKAYGQNLFIFGQKKGSGESVWEIKKKVGYFTPAMTDRFGGYHTLENMLISGFHDSVGLYIKPSEIEKRKAKEWLQLLSMEQLSQSYFHDLSLGQQRLLMCARAMIKHPLLLILDEPTAGLDDKGAALIVDLVNKLAKESEAAVIFVSHREEPGLRPELTYTLSMKTHGSTGKKLPD